MTRRATLTQNEVRRRVAGAVEGLAAAGIQIGSVTISPAGEIVLYAAGADSAPRANPLDRLLENGP